MCFPWSRAAALKMRTMVLKVAHSSLLGSKSQLFDVWDRKMNVQLPQPSYPFHCDLGVECDVTLTVAKPSDVWETMEKEVDFFFTQFYSYNLKK
jgi:hypothetical protein